MRSFFCVHNMLYLHCVTVLHPSTSIDIFMLKPIRFCLSYDSKNHVAKQLNQHVISCYYVLKPLYKTWILPSIHIKTFYRCDYLIRRTYHILIHSTYHHTHHDK